MRADSSIPRLSCAVFIDTIADLWIRTVQTTLDHGCQRVIRLMAKDAANNTFSALEGLPFHWTVPSATPALATEPGSKSDAMCVPRSTTSCSVVTPLLLSSSSMKVTAIRRGMELHDGVETDQIALATADMRPGSATVEAKPNNDTGLWKQDPTIHLHAIKKMYVVERLVVDPGGRSAVVINSCFAYQLFTMRKCRNESELVYTSPRTPHERFEWSSTNEGVALVDKKYGAVTARALGEAEITVNHRSNHNNAEYDGIYLARIYIQVVEAGMIDLVAVEYTGIGERIGTRRTHSNMHPLIRLINNLEWVKAARER